jgi:hypothetical protein
MVCVKEHGTLAGLLLLPKDNETINKLGIGEQEGSGSLDSIPELPEEPVEEASPTINF